MEKKKKVRILAGGIVLTLLLGCVGCSGGDTETAVTTEPTSTIDESRGGAQETTVIEAATEPTQESTATEPAEDTADATKTNTEDSEAVEDETTIPTQTTGPAEPGHKHSYSAQVVTPTCTEDGYTVYTCSCGDSYTGDRVSEVGHEWGSWVTTKCPTTTSTGTAERKCSSCNTIETKTLEMLHVACTHNYECTVFGPTCIRAGYDYYCCTLCGDSYTEEWGSLGEHSYSLVSAVTGDCATGKDGSETYKCSVCGDTYTEIVTGGHDWVHYHTDEVGHWGGYLVCHCGGWEWHGTPEEDLGSSFADHLTKMKEETGTTAGHSYYEIVYWVVDIPAEDYEICAVCGIRKD